MGNILVFVLLCNYVLSDNNEIRGSVLLEKLGLLYIVIIKRDISY